MDTADYADITWSSDGRPLSRTFAQAYFSADGINECRFVFLRQNQLNNRWQKLTARAVFTIAETGFGCGLNFLATWQSWQKYAPTDATLNFISVEQYPLLKSDLEQALRLWPELQPLSQPLLEQYPPVDARGFHQLHFGNVHLTLIFADALDGVEQLLNIPSPGPAVSRINCGWSPFTTSQGPIDAWFLDGFAPTKAPGMWRSELLAVIVRLSHPETTFAASTVNPAEAMAVQQKLESAGFNVSQTLALAPERHVVCGNPVGQSEHSVAARTNTSLKSPVAVRKKPSASWHLCQRQVSPPWHVAVIGAGLAGCHTAFALAQQGYEVTLIDRADIASGASGNPKGIVYSKLSPNPGVLADFNIAALTYALRFYQQEQLFALCGEPCGVLQMPENDRQAAQQQNIGQVFRHSPELVQYLNQSEASAVAGISLLSGALWLPQAGWLDPPEACRTLVQHPRIRVLTHRQIETLKHKDGQWLLLDNSNTLISTAPAVVVACADSARRFSQCAQLPIKAIRGQISWSQANSESSNLRTVLCGHGYIAPARNNRHVIGASFNLNSQATENCWNEHQDNLEQVHALAPAFENLNIAALTDGRVSFRCTTPDYLPMVGPVAHHDRMLVRFGAYRQNLKATIDAPGEYWPGLFLNIGNGSKGLTYAPLCAQLLACMISNRTLPMTRQLALHVHPARFLIRDLSRRRL